MSSCLCSYVMSSSIPTWPFPCHISIKDIIIIIIIIIRVFPSQG